MFFAPNAIKGHAIVAENMAYIKAETTRRNIFDCTEKSLYAGRISAAAQSRRRA